MNARQTLIEHLPDIPRWVEARDLVLNGEMEVIGLSVDRGLNAVLRDVEEGSVFVIGRPASEAIAQAVSRRVQTGDVVCGIEQADWVAEHLPGSFMAPACSFNQSSAGIMVAKMPANRIATSRMG